MKIFKSPIQAKAALICTVSTVLVVSDLAADAINFVAETETIIIAGDPQDKVDRDTNNLNASGFYVAEADFSNFIGDSAWMAGSATITIQERDAIISFMNTFGYTSAEMIAKPPATLDGFSDLFSGSTDSVGVNFHPVMAFTANVGSVEYFGVVTSNFKTIDLAVPPVDFKTSDNNWDTTLVGVSGSLELAQVVPEPASYAMLAGLLAGGWVFMRRRRIVSCHPTKNIS